MTAVAGGARHDPRILTAGMQGRRGCLEAFRGPCRSPGVLTTTAHPATTPGALTSTSRKIWKFPDTIFGILPLDLALRPGRNAFIINAFLFAALYLIPQLPRLLRPRCLRLLKYRSAAARTGLKGREKCASVADNTCSMILGI